MSEIDDKAAYRHLFGETLSKADLRKMQILEAAIASFARQGYEGTSFLAIGKKLGIPASHIAYYFPNKDTLLEFVMKYVTAKTQREVMRRLEGAEGAKAVLAGMFTAFFEYYRDHPDEVKAAQVFVNRCMHHEPSRRLYTEMRKHSHKRMEAIVGTYLKKRGAGESEIRAKARAIYQLHSGALRELLVTDAHGGVTRQIRDFIDYASVILDA